MTYPFEAELEPEEREFLKTLTDEERAFLELRIKQGAVKHPNNMSAIIAALDIKRAGEDEDEEEFDGMFSPEYAEKIGEKDGKPIYKVVIK